MKYIKSKSGLMIPLNTEHITNQYDFKLKSIEELGQKLSDENPLQATKKICEILKETNQLIIPYEDRFNLLSMLKQKIISSTNTLKHMYSDNDVLDPKTRILNEIIDNLKLGMLTGYKLVINDGLNHVLYKNKIILSALNHALYYSSRVLFTSFKHHMDVPKDVWYDFHSIYTLAQKKGFAFKKEPSAFGQSYKLQTIHDIYKHFLLLGIMRTERFQQKTITQFLYVTEAWAPLLTITNQYKKEQSKYYIDPNSDSPPQLITAFTPPPSTPGYFIDVTKIIERIEKLIARHNFPTQEHKYNPLEIELSMPVYLLEKLLKTWAVPFDRAYKRSPFVQQIRVCLGLASIYEHIGQHKRKSKTDVVLETFESEEINLDAFLLPQERLGLAIQDKLAQPFYVGETRDKSEGGCCISWTEDKPKYLINGEIVAVELKNESGQAEISIGIVRWLKNEVNSLVVGIEFVSKNVLPVVVKLADKEESYFIPSLLMGSQRNDKKEYKLITNTMAFRSGSNVSVKLGENTLAGNLLEEFSISSLYKEFSLSLNSGDTKFILESQPDIAQHFNVQ